MENSIQWLGHWDDIYQWLKQNHLTWEQNGQLPRVFRNKFYIEDLVVIDYNGVEQHCGKMDTIVLNDMGLTVRHIDGA